jgi:hypothetical protein
MMSNQPASYLAQWSKSWLKNPMLKFNDDYELKRKFKKIYAEHKISTRKRTLGNSLMVFPLVCYLWKVPIKTLSKIYK